MIINIFSTINIEGAIFDKPLINISYQKNSNFYDKNMKSRYDVNIDFKQDHNQRILSTKGITNCWNGAELNKMRKKKLLYLSDILVNIFYDLKVKSIFKSQFFLIVYIIRKFLSKFFN